MKAALFLILLPIGGCIDAAKQPVRQTPTCSFVDSTFSEVDRKESPKRYTYPTVWLKPIVKNVNFRTTPSLSDTTNAYVLDVGTTWTGKISEQENAMPIRGIKLPWLEVATDNDNRQYLWVYEGSVAPYIFNFGNLLDTAISNRWVEFEPIDGPYFHKIKYKNGIDTLIHSEDEKSEKPDMIRLLINGKPKVFTDHLDSGEGYSNYTYLEKKQGWHIIKFNGWEWSCFIFTSTTSGLEYNTMGSSSYLPLTSPKRKKWAFPSSQSYGDNYSTGFEVFDLETNRSFFVNIDEGISRLIWEDEQTILFCTDKNRFYRFGFKNIFQKN